MILHLALRILLQQEALRPQRETALIDTIVHQRNNDHFPSNDTWWKPGSLCIGVLNHNPTVAMPMIIVGARENNRYAITAEDTPVLLQFSPEDMGEVAMRVAKASTEKDAQKFVTKACANGIKRGTKIIPLRTAFLKYVLENNGGLRHPHRVYQAVKDIKTPDVKMFQAWAKAAALKKDADTDRSAIELSPTSLTQFPNMQAYQIARDLTDAFDNDVNEEFIDQLLHALQPLVRTEPDTIEDPEQGPTQAHLEAEDSDDVEDVTPPVTTYRDIEQNQQSNFRNTQDYRSKRRSSPHSPNSEQPTRGRSAVHWNTQTSTKGPGWMDFNQNPNQNNQDQSTPTYYSQYPGPSNPWDNAGNSYSTNRNHNAWQQGPGPFNNERLHRRDQNTRRGTRSNPPYSSSQATTNNFSYVDASDASRKLQELTDIAVHRPLSQQEMNQWKVLHATTSSTPETGGTSKNFLGMLQFSVFAWSKTHPKDKRYLNDWNNSFWPKLNNCKNKADARHVVETELFQPLLHRNPKLINCLHDDLKEAVVNFRFKPNNLESDKPTLGLGPLAFVPRERKEIEMMSHQLAINEAANQTSTTDVERTKLGRPKIPKTVDGYNSVIESCKEVNEFLFTDRCEYVELLQGCLLALYKNYHTFEHMDDFGKSVGAELLYQLTRAAEQIYGTATSEHQLLEGNLPHLDFDFLVTGIRNNNLNTSQSRPQLFVPTSKKLRHPTHHPKDERERRGPQRDKQRSGERGNPLVDKTPVSRQLPADMKKLFDDWFKANKNKRLPNISDFRTASAIADDEALLALLGMAKGGCIRYALLGRCRKDCKREHAKDFSGFNVEAATEIIRKGLLE